MSLRPGIASFAGALAMALVPSGSASGQAAVSRITGLQPWRAADGDSDAKWNPERNGMAISANDRWAVFESAANNLVPYDLNPAGDVFACEVVSGRIVGITSSKSFTANAACYDPAISGDGRYVVFATAASNLIANDTNGDSDVYAVDRDPDGNGIFDEQPYAFERVSVDPYGAEVHGDSLGPSISDDGSRVAFVSFAPDLDQNDYNGWSDAFLRDRWNATTVRVDVDSGGLEADYGCEFADLSPDGNTVAFSSWSDNLAWNDVNQGSDVFVHDVWYGTTECVSVNFWGDPGNSQSFISRRCLSSDGMLVAFASDSDDLTYDGNGRRDVFLRNRWSGVTTLVSLDSYGGQGDADSDRASVCADGSRITFASLADNLVANDRNQLDDVFLREVNAGTTTLVSASTGGGAANGMSGAATISADGGLVVFSSTADDLEITGDVAGFRDVFVSDLAGTIRYASALQAGDPNGPSMLPADDRSHDRPALSADGRFVAFESDATNFVDGDGNGVTDVFVADRSNGSIVRVSVSASGVQGNGRSFHPAMSSTGRFVAFASAATTLIGADVNGATCDVFVCDRDPDGNGVFDEGNPVVTLESVDSSGNQANGWSDSPSLSGDGRWIAFTSTATNLDPSDTTTNPDIYRRDRSTGQTFDVTSSHYSDVCDRPSMSSDGSAVAYTAYTYSVWGVLSQWAMEYAPALGGYLTVEKTYSAYPTTFAPCNSKDGKRVALVNYDYWGSTSQVGVYDLPYSTSIWTMGFAGFAVPAMNPSGRQVVIDTVTSLSSNDANTTHDVYLFDDSQREDGALGGFSTPILVSRSTSGSAGNADSVLAVPSEDGDLVVFASDASDLVAFDVNGCRDLFVYDRTPSARWLNYGAGFAGPHWIPGFTSSAAPVLGSTITLSFGNSSGIPVNALVFLSVNDANVTLPWGATFLVDLATSLRFLVPLGASGGSVTGTVPSDPALAGLSIYLQALEYDAAVPHKLSFTPGVELHLGY